jgi:hypothetical protein
MSGKTAGQQVYETLGADPASLAVPWAFLSADDRQVWEAAAAAVETEQVRLAREDRDSLRKRVLDLAAALEAEGDEEITIARKRQGAADDIDRNRGRVFKLCASRLRKIAGPPS